MKKWRTVVWDLVMKAPSPAVCGLPVGAKTTGANSLTTRLIADPWVLRNWRQPMIEK
jgi:hypothetical protein